MRDLKKYGEVYSEYGFEEYQIKYRRKKVLSILNRYDHRCIVDIGAGPEPLFCQLMILKNTIFLNR